MLRVAIAGTASLEGPIRRHLAAPCDMRPHFTMRCRSARSPERRSTSGTAIRAKRDRPRRRPGHSTNCPTS
jgi:hypothetical protein